MKSVVAGAPKENDGVVVDDVFVVECGNVVEIMGTLSSSCA